MYSLNLKLIESKRNCIITVLCNKNRKSVKESLIVCDVKESLSLLAFFHNSKLRVQRLPEKATIESIKVSRSLPAISLSWLVMPTPFEDVHAVRSMSDLSIHI
jgi:hypothetical protein